MPASLLGERMGDDSLRNEGKNAGFAKEAVLCGLESQVLQLFGYDKVV